MSSTSMARRKLVAISPMFPDGSFSMAERNALVFEVLSDAATRSPRVRARVQLSDELVSIYKDTWNIVLPQVNGDNSWELPIPGTFVIAGDGVVRYAFVDPDYTRRAEPADIITALVADRINIAGDAPRHGRPNPPTTRAASPFKGGGRSVSPPPRARTCLTKRAPSPGWPALYLPSRTPRHAKGWLGGVLLGAQTYPTPPPWKVSGRRVLLAGTVETATRTIRRLNPGLVPFETSLVTLEPTLHRSGTVGGPG